MDDVFTANVKDTTVWEQVMTATPLKKSTVVYHISLNLINYCVQKMKMAFHQLI